MTAVPVPSAVLRATATEIRERANAAFGPRWQVELVPDAEDDYLTPEVQDANGVTVAECTTFDLASPWAQGKHDAEHIASWDPVTALAVADLLDKAADVYDFGQARKYPEPRGNLYLAALEICAAYNRTGEAS